MKKHIKLVVFVVSMLIVFVTYNVFKDKSNKIIYIPLGDSIAEGMNPYHNVDYGYTDYISNYLNKNNKLSFYTKKFTKSGYKISDVTNDINNNKVIEVDGKRLYLKEILRESDLVTLTIGANDLLDGMNMDDIPKKLLNMELVKKDIDEVSKSLKELIILIKKYAKNQIIVTGYFNPLPRLTTFKSDIDEVVKYFNNEIENICIDLDINYVDIYNIFDKNKEILPNPLDIHPNKYGYELISKEIIKSINS